MSAPKDEAPKFWRLLADYERLTHDEGVALRAKDFAAATGFQERKKDLLAALGPMAQRLGLKPTDPPLRDRVAALFAAEREHHTIVSNQIALAQKQRRSVDVARSRLRGLEHAYGHEASAPRAEAFFARG